MTRSPSESASIAIAKKMPRRRRDRFAFGVVLRGRAQRVHNDQAAVAQAQQAVNQAQASVNAAQARVDADAADVKTQLAANAAATSAVEHDKAVLDELKKAQAAGKSVSKP